MVLLVGLLALALGAAACSSSDDGDSDTGSSSDNGSSSSGGAAVAAESGLVFAPKSISATVGEAVTVTFTNNDALVHNFESELLGFASGDVDPDGSIMVTFTPSEAGSFEFFCSIPGHREAGMDGLVSVS
jgi:plastocyanin